MDRGDISQAKYGYNCELCQKYSWGNSKNRKGPKDIVSCIADPSIRGVT